MEPIHLKYLDQISNLQDELAHVKKKQRDNLLEENRRLEKTITRLKRDLDDIESDALLEYD